MKRFLINVTMKRVLTASMFLMMNVMANAITVTDTIFDRKANEENFAFGADVGFVSQMESWGTKWLDKDGKQKDILQILKEQGINNVRLRVWVNPSGGWCGKDDVVKMAKRAKAKGMGVMLSFHYSDTWADPGTQDPPAAWKNHTVAQLEQDVYNHTKEVISALQAAGITPKWAQIGNETKRGMFYPTCQTNKGGTDNFARMLKAGIKACRECDPSIKTIIHLPDGHDNSLYRSMFDALKSRGVVWDMIGMSAYPRWSHLDGPTMISQVMANIKDLEQRYGTKVMVVETGHYWNKPIEANQYLVGLMAQLIKNGDPGCFYWEPESLEGYDLGAWDRDSKRPTVAMDAFLGIKHTEVSWLMKANVSSPSNYETLTADNAIELTSNVKHVRNRIYGVDWYVDKKNIGTVKESPYSLTSEIMPIGVHNCFIKAIDTDKNIQMSDTVTFFIGESTQLENEVISNGNLKEDHILMGLNFTSGGKYRLAIGYNANTFHTMTLSMSGDSICKISIFKATGDYKQTDIEVAEGGYKELKLKANTTKGLPEITDIRIFPLDGQNPPSASEANSIPILSSCYSGVIEIYDLSGRLLCYSSEEQLGNLLGDSPSSVIVFTPSSLPSCLARNCVGGKPYILRKQRLK